MTCSWIKHTSFSDHVIEKKTYADINSMSKISADFYEPYFQHVKKCRPQVVHSILFIRRLGGTDRKLFFPYVKYEYIYKAILYYIVQYYLVASSMTFANIVTYSFKIPFLNASSKSIWTKKNRVYYYRQKTHIHV